MPNSSLSHQNSLTALTLSPALQFLGYGTHIDEAEQEAWYKHRSDQAQRAFERGRDCVERGLLEAGFFWLGRAERLAGENAHVIFSYAMAAFELGYWSIALEKFDVLTEKYRVREAVFGALICLYRLERRLEARNLLAKTLSSYVLSEELYHLADELSFLEGHGWITLSNHGFLIVRSERPFRLAIDGKRLGEFQPGRYHLGEIEGLEREWFRSSTLSVRVEGEHLLGSPLTIDAITKCDSLVKATENGLEGWVFYPAEPEFKGRLFIDNAFSERGKQRQEIVFSERTLPPDATHPFWQPGVFSRSLEELPELGREKLVIRDQYHRPLLGVPLDLCLGKLLAGQKPFPAHLRPVPVMSPYHMPRRAQNLRAKRPDCAVIIPVYRDYRTVMTCLESVLETVPSWVEVLVIDDAIEEELLKQALEDLKEAGKITLLKHAENRGYPASINHGLRYVGERDVILLNSDTIVFPFWVERLQAWLAHEHVGTVTPFSNEAGLSSYPAKEGGNALPHIAQARKLDSLCQELTDRRLIEMPTGNGFCMAISASCLAETGLLREDIFAQGYGEENDFCLRARMRGFVHIVATDIYVRHIGGASFQEGKRELIKRNLEILNALHPGYHQMVSEFEKRDPLHLMRRRLDQAFLENRRVGQKKMRGTILMIQHNAGGGVARAVEDRARVFEKEHYLVLSLKPTEEGCRLLLCAGERMLPNLSFSLPTEGALLVSFLNRLKLQHIEWHHLVGHAPWIRRLHRLLDVPYDIFIHDHIWFCPRIALLDNHGRYCGEPDKKACETCLTYAPAPVDEVPLEELLARSLEEMTKARKVVAPTLDAARRLKRHLALKREIEISPWENDSKILETPLKQPAYKYRRKLLRLGVIGGISRWKGYDIIKEMGAYILDHNLPIEIVLIGESEDDDGLLASGIKITGAYKEKDVLTLIKTLDIDIGFIPSIAPETWCYSVSWLWKAGLRVLCFDIGAVSERVKKSARGMVIPLGMPAGHILTYLMRL